MEIKLNKDLQKMQDNLVFGFNLRQTICTAVGALCSVAAYLVANKHGLNTELASWICVAVVAPFAAFGFVTVNGMSFDRFVLALVKQYILCPRKIVYHLENDLYERDKEKIVEAHRKEAQRND